MVDLASHTILQSFDKDFAKLSLYQMFFLLTQANWKYPSCFGYKWYDCVGRHFYKNDSLQPIKCFPLYYIQLFYFYKPNKTAKVC